MSKRKYIIGLTALAAVVAGWAIFRPELLFVNKKVNEQFPRTASANGNAPMPVEIASGQFHGVAHETRGIATIFRLPDGKKVLRFSQFETSNGPDVNVYLVAASDANDNDTVTKAGFVSLGPIKGNLGDQNYDLPDGVDLQQYRSVTIWCKRFGVNFGTAPLAQKTAVN